MNLRAGLLAVTGLAGTIGLWPQWPALAAAGRAPGAWIDRVGVDGAAVTMSALVLWAVCLRILAGLLALLAARLPGAAGQVGSAVARLVLPRLAVRLLVGAAGLGVLLAPVAAGAAPVAAGPAAARAVAAAVPVPAPSAAWPLTPAPRSVPAPAWPTTTPPTTTPPTTTPPTTTPPTTTPPTTTPPTTAPPTTPAPATPATRTPPTPPTPPTAASAPDPSADTVTVRPGDSLWVIAAHRLGAQATDDRIAAAWPAWYAANRAAIGPDPALLHPGQVLHAPADVPTAAPWPTDQEVSR